MTSRILRFLIQFTIGIAILLWLLSLADLNKVFSILTTVNILNLVLASAFFIVASTFVALSLYISLKPFNSTISMNKTILASFAGQLLSDITPARSGYFATPLILNKLCNLSIGEGITGVFITGITNSIIKVVFAVLGILYFIRFLPIHPSLINSIIISVIILIIGSIILLILTLEKSTLKIISIFERFPFIRRIVFKTSELISQIQYEIKKTKRVIHHVTLLMLLSLIANATALYIIYNTLWLGDITLIDFIFIAAIVSTLMYLPITISGLGVQETGYIILLTLFGTPLEIALIFSLIVRLLFTGTDIIGVPTLIKLWYILKETQ
ncbi:MAG: lysylphosphatidylglycerol synthase transmembrane domain-containing protein [Candidatus Methanomethylicia archaeon]